MLRRLGGRLGRSLVIALPYVWLFLFFLIPFVIVLKIAFADKVIGQPPYTPLWDWVDDTHLGITLSLGNFQFLLDDPLYVSAYFSSLKIAAISTVLSLLVGYPMAYAIARSSQQWRVPLLMLVILPFWTSFLIRVYAWIGILQQQGLLNNLLLWLGIIDQPLEILHTDVAVYIGIVYSYLPFMILPLYATLEKLDVSLLEAAEDLGCRPWKAFLLITLPLSLPGIIAGSLLVFIPAVGEYVIPELLGGIDTLMIGKVLSNEFFQNTDWPVASAVAIVLLLVLVIPIMIFQYVQAKQQEAER
ncbi:spermidine/putrescine ABC transporter permease [Inquilinus limosus MP06]|uniref:Spermidine/putrescine ABC transporter permease n=1 Tax=Inquilinus limosus MP06 TaxID=1398085 RepID=A0A0A0DBA2_9PROT|nr:ABC transporter permease subunit [Inquilinus limosus]KGM35344.1 spermidine/putrescine ABC transporter permease [Inquilinus limosus MP06]